MTTPPENTKGKRPFDATSNSCIKKVVVKVSILALLLSVTACNSENGITAEPENLLAAADSAERVVWGELAVTRSDSVRPSAFFDTTYKYLLPAVLIEREKRVVVDSFARKTVLAADRLQTNQQRLNGIRTIRELEHRDSLWRVRIDSLTWQYARSISAYLDSARVDTAEKQAIIRSIVVRERFVPKWRDRLDSLTRETLRVQREIIHFIDTASKRIRIEGALQFTESSDMITYQGFTSALESLAIAQAEALQASYIDDRSRSTTEKEDTEPPAVNDSSVKVPPRSWPEAVRIR